MIAAYQKIIVEFLKQMRENLFNCQEIKVKVDQKEVVKRHNYHQYLRFNQNKRIYKKEIHQVKVKQEENRCHKQLVKSNQLLTFNNYRLVDNELFISFLFYQ